MGKIDQLKAYIAEHPMELDVLMMEVYQQLTRDMQGFTMFDGGSHKGWHALRMLQLPGCARVFAIEADPTMGETLTQNLKKWHTDPEPELIIVRKALQNNPDVNEIPWMSSHSHVGRSSILADNQTTPTIWSEHKDVEYRDLTKVPATTIDQIFDGNGTPVPFLKLDLEGADFLALQGAAETLQTKRPVVAFENSSKAPAVHGYSLQDVSDFFNGLGYIPLNYVAEPMSPDTWFDFHEAWVIPMERLSEVQALISAGVQRRI